MATLGKVAFSDAITEALQNHDKQKNLEKEDKLLEVNGNVPVPSKAYTLDDTSSGIKEINITDVKDKNVFKVLFPITGNNQNIGYGEVALFWLFGGMREKPTALMNQEKNKPDLLISNGGSKIDVGLEVKSYKGFQSMTGVGRFQENIVFREMVSIIFGVANLVSSNAIKNTNIKRTANQKFIDVLNFNYKDLVRSADKFCDLRTSILSIPKDKREDLYNILPFFSQFEGNFKKFEELAMKIGIKEKNILCGTDDKAPGGEVIGKVLTKYLLNHLLKVKPGNNGFFMDPGNSDQTTPIQYLRVNLSNIDNLDEETIDKSFKAHGAVLSIKLGDIFGKNK